MEATHGGATRQRSLGPWDFEEQSCRTSLFCHSCHLGESYSSVLFPAFTSGFLALRPDLRVTDREEADSGYTREKPTELGKDPELGLRELEESGSLLVSGLHDLTDGR